MGRNNLLTGNWGEQYISERLTSCRCFVRHVPQGHDTGVDLYCETTSDDRRPFAHFWCQVKTAQFKGKKPRMTLNRGSKNVHVDYWLKQPIPVFIFKVPDMRNENINGKEMIPFYIFNAIDFHNNEKFIKSSLKVEKVEHLNNFLKERLLIETFRWDLMRGRVSHLLPSEPSYTITFRSGQTLKFEEELKESLRWTLFLLTNDILGKKCPNSVSEAGYYATMLEILVQWIKDKHYESYEVIGKYYRENGVIQKALDNYKKALNHLYNDPNSEVSRNDIRWREVFERIELAIKELEAGRIIPSQPYKVYNDVCATTAVVGTVKS